MSFPAYPSYRDSGNEWLGDVPAHWDVTRLKQACEVFPSNVDKKTVEGQQGVRLCNYTDVYYNDEIHDGMPFMEASATDDQIERFELRAGDTIFTKDSETPDDIARSTYVPVDLPGVICGYHLSMARPNAGTCGAFIKRYFDASTTRAYFHVKANGLTRVGLGQYAVDNAPIALPPLPEQTAIAAFLDRETAKIDALVEEQRRLIELLKEKRQAVISHAVTKGLDPTVPMKDSGVEWLGQVPAHWEVPKLRRISERVVVGIAEAAVHAYADEGVPILRSMNVRPERLQGSLLYLKAEYAEERESKRLRGGDILTVRTGHAGVSALVPEELDGAHCFTMLVTTLKADAEAAFICKYLNSAPARFYFNLEAWGSAQPNISVPILQDIPVPVPPVAEQKAIIVALEAEQVKTDALSAKAEAAISIMLERRGALISAAVTGKIDVRGVALKQAEAA